MISIPRIALFSLILASSTVAQTTKPAGKSANYSAERARFVNEKDEIVTVLSNGLTVIAKRVPSPVVAVRGYVGTGGIYEGKWLGGGLSHLLEHLVAGGSTKNRTEAENRSLLQKIGNNSNAYTTADHTAYFINTTPDHMVEAVDLLTGWLFGALITPDEYAREYEVVQRELEKGKGEPGRQFYYLGQINRYRVHPVRVPVIGYQEVIQGLTRDDVYSYYQLAYQPQNIVLSIAGDLDPEQMLAAVQKNVGEIKPGREFIADLPAEPEVLGPRTIVGTFPKLGQAKLQLAFPSIKLDHPDLYALDLLSTILSGGESSVLVEELRDKRQLVSGIDTSSYTPHYVEGSFEIEMELDSDKIADSTKAVFDEIEKIKNEGVSDDRLQRAKVQVRTARVKGQQTSEAIASSLAGDYMSTGDPHFSDRYTERMQNVTAEQVQAMARKYLDKAKLITTAMLPAEYVGAAGLPKAEDLLRPVAPPTPTGGDDKASSVTRVELENGTILLHKQISTSPLVAIQMYALGGVAAEDAKTNGLGNLAMELAMRGTKTRSAQQIAEFFDSIGGSMGTSTGNNSWFWTAQVMKEDFANAMEVYADVVNKPSFPEAELKPMRQRILAAIDSQDADWNSQSMKFFKQAYFGPNKSPYQFLSIGTKDNVEGFTRDQVQKWYDEQVRPARRVLAIFGDVSLNDAKAKAAKYLGEGPKLGDYKREPAVPKPELVEPQPTIDVERVEVQKTEQPLAGVVIGFQSDSVIGDPSNFPITVADTMASGYGYPTGYLHEILRGRGLVYVVHGQNWPGRETKLPGTFMVFAGADPRKVNEVVDLILENIARLQGTPADVQEDWFQRSKDLINISDAMDNETASEQATVAALDELYGLGYDYHTKFADKINEVTLDDVRNIARDRLRKAVVTISTPAPELVKVEKGTRTYKEFPRVDLTPRGVQHDTGGAP